MDGREPVYGATSGASTSSLSIIFIKNIYKIEHLANLDEIGFGFIRTCIELIEEKGHF